MLIHASCFIISAKCGYCKLGDKTVSGNEFQDVFHDKLFDPIRKDVIDRNEWKASKCSRAEMLVEIKTSMWF